MKRTRNYASDLTDGQWQVIRQLLPKPARRGSQENLPTLDHRRHPLRDTNGVPMANAAKEFSELEYGVRCLPAVEA